MNTLAQIIFGFGIVGALLNSTPKWMHIQGAFSTALILTAAPSLTARLITGRSGSHLDGSE
jgi:hypothetical protein